MSKLEKYSSYKESGVEWLGEIPEGWELTRLGTKFIERKEKVSDKDYEPLSVTRNGIVPQLDSAAKSNDGDNRKLVKKGDFVINSRSDRKGSSGVSPLDGSVSLINIVLEPLNINPDFCNYLLKSNGFIEEFYRNGHGIVADLWTTRFWDMKSIMLGIPPKQEQTKIASFLDTKTEQLDKVIKQKEQLIELLKERRQILINDAVTKGIDKTVAMKDSGVEWIGEIPEHWEVRKLKYSLQLQNKKTSIKEQQVIALENIESFTGKYIETSSKYDGEDNLFQKNDILFGKLRPYLAKVFLCKSEGVAFGDLLTYRPNNNFDSKFAFYLLISAQFIKTVDSSTYGSKMPRASSSFINEMLIGIPPKEEQVQIADYIDDNNQKTDKAIDLQKQQITKLKEYKTTLIDSVVTGKARVS